VERELAVTRKVLAALPAEKFDWKPHEKSMSLGRLAIHVANLPNWAHEALDSDLLDFAKAPRPPEKMGSTEELVRYFDQQAEDLRQATQNSTWHAGTVPGPCAKATRSSPAKAAPRSTACEA
jgi:uncharacterized damage-inducible protein DinB